MRSSLLAFLLLGACTPHGIAIDPGDTDSDSTSPDTHDTDPSNGGTRCSPQAVIDEPFYTEGDAISFAFECGNGASAGGFDASMSSLPDGASFDAQTWSLSWIPGLDQGDRYDLLLSVRPADDDSAFPESAVATFWVADNIDHPNNEPVDPATYTEEWGLSVIHLEPQQAVGQTHVPAVVTVYGHEYLAEMKIRGAASASYPKPSYTIRFSEEDLDASHWDMGNKDHLYAITAFDENSYVRQKLCYDLWNAMAEHWERDRLTPRTFFGIIYLSGQYQGVYTFSDRPDDHFAQEMGLSADGNLYKAVSHYANFYRTYGGSQKSSLHDGYEKKEGEPVDGQPDAYWDLEDLVAWTADASDQEFVDEHEAWLRLDEFMDWFLFVHWTASDDSAGKNAYLYNDPENFEFRYIPWDFNHSWGQDWRTLRVSSSTYNDFTWTNRVFKAQQAVDGAALWARTIAWMEE